MQKGIKTRLIIYEILKELKNKVEKTSQVLKTCEV